MEGKLFVYLLALAGIIGVTYFVYFTNEVDEAQAELTQLTANIENHREAVKNNASLLEMKKEVAAWLKATAVVEAEIAKLRKQLSAVQEEEQALALQFSTVILRNRNQTVGMTFPELKLANGLVLRNARIQNVEDDGLRVQHSTGLMKIGHSDLPEDLKDRLRYPDASKGFIPGATAKIKAGTAAKAAPRNSGFANTSVSDNARLGGLSSDSTGSQKSKPPGRPVNTTQGDPNLWKSVTRQGLGRAYIPGQGWLEVGPNGPIPGTGR